MPCVSLSRKNFGNGGKQDKIALNIILLYSTLEGALLFDYFVTQSFKLKGGTLHSIKLLLNKVINVLVADRLQNKSIEVRRQESELRIQMPKLKT